MSLLLIPVIGGSPPVREKEPAEQLLGRLYALDRDDARQQAVHWAYVAGELLDAMVRLHRALEVLEQPVALPECACGQCCELVRQDRQAKADAALASLRARVKAELKLGSDVLGMSRAECPW